MPPKIRWRKGNMLGQGAFCSVYMGLNLDTGELMAVKEVLFNSKKATVDTVIREVKLLSALDHPHIVKYLGTDLSDKQVLNIFMEYCPGGSLESLITKFGTFPDELARLYTRQILLGLQYLHEAGILHRDIKGGNILVTNDGAAKLSDFGASRDINELASGGQDFKGTVTGTPLWMAPEVVLEKGYGKKADIYSLGATVMEMLTGKPPNSQIRNFPALVRHWDRNETIEIPSHLSVLARDFLDKTLRFNPDERWTPTQLLEHPFASGAMDNFNDEGKETPGFASMTISAGHREAARPSGGMMRGMTIGPSNAGAFADDGEGEPAGSSPEASTGGGAAATTDAPKGAAAARVDDGTADGRALSDSTGSGSGSQSGSDSEELVPQPMKQGAGAGAGAGASALGGTSSAAHLGMSSTMGAPRRDFDHAPLPAPPPGAGGNPGRTMSAPLGGKLAAAVPAPSKPPPMVLTSAVILVADPNPDSCAATVAQFKTIQASRVIGVHTGGELQAVLNASAGINLFVIDTNFPSLSEVAFSGVASGVALAMHLRTEAHLDYGFRIIFTSDKVADLPSAFKGIVNHEGMLARPVTTTALLTLLVTTKSIEQMWSD